MNHPISAVNSFFYICGCHRVGQRIVMPRSLGGLESWRTKTAKSRATFSTIPAAIQRDADFNKSAGRESALRQEWEAYHPWVVDARPALKFVGVKKLRRVGRKMKFTRKAVLKRMAASQKPTSSIEHLANRHPGYD